MRIAICDDNKEERVRLSGLLAAYAGKKGYEIRIAEYDSGIALCEAVEKLREYRVVFLNVNMKEPDGLKTAMYIKETNPTVHIVLVSEDMNDALDGYRVKATRFLLKKDLELMVGECMDNIIREIGQNERQVQYAFVEGYATLKTDEIIYIETSRHKNIFHTNNGNYSIYRKLDELARDLDGKGFVRIHQSYLVNMRYVEKISSYVMRLTTGEELSVPKSRYPGVKRVFMQFKGIE